MIVLDSATKVLRARLAAAIATAEPSFVMAYADKGGDLGSNAGVLNGTTNVTLVAAPAAGIQRVVRSGTLCNIDTAAVTVILESYDGTTASRICKVTLNVDSILTITGDGLQIISATGGSISFSWGDIGGTLSSQTDLQSALNAKAGTAAANAFTQQQAVTPYRANISGAVSIDLAATAKSNKLILTLTGNVSSFALTNAVDGASYSISLIQDATGGRTMPALGSSFKFSNATAPTWTTTANARDKLVLDYDGTAALYECAQVPNLS